MLSEKYRPHLISDFIGLEKPRKIVGKLAENPRSCSLLFVGPSGTGKTTMALALAEAISAEVIHIPSQQGNVAQIEQAVAMTQYVPMLGKRFWLILIDEVDSISKAAQLALLSKLDATGFPRDTIFVATCNSTDGLEPRFLSRWMNIEFSSYGMASEIASFLKRVWQSEAPGAPMPDVTRLSKEKRNNVRDCLMSLETEMLAL